MAIAYLLLGSNLGNRAENLDKAILLLKEIGVEILGKSSIYETEPWGFSEQGAFYNQALKVKSSLLPVEFLNAIKRIEEFMGREDYGRWRERLIDIDIIYYEDKIMNNDKLTIPHPEMQLRRFVLLPLIEIAPEFKHPIFNLTNKDLLDKCEDPLKVSKI